MGAATILLTGASGYIGGRLLRRLEEARGGVRCLARQPDFVRARLGNESEAVQGDVLCPESLEAAFQGIEVGYYLVHSMGASGAFEELDRSGALNFGRAARAAGVKRIIYLGGLGDETTDLSPHLRSRHEVGRTLRESGVPVIEFRASIVIGSGSLSFELVRALVERLPLMITPRWVEVTAQPIAIGDVLDYLVAALDLETPESRIYEIGGADRVSYRDLMREYARQRGLRRRMISLPALSANLSSLWLGLVTPIYARVGRSLIEGIRHETCVRNPRALADFDIAPMGIAPAIEAALHNEELELAETRWSDAVSAGPSAARNPVGLSVVTSGRRLVDVRRCLLDVDSEQAFAPIRRLGGTTGWYAYDWLWSLRGWIDLLLGGVGTRRGRAHPDRLSTGEPLDWWRVELYEPDRRLRLRAEMILPGRAWLEFEVSPLPGGSQVTQTAIFDPTGLAGLAYWYGVAPLHALVFRGLLDGIAAAARANASQLPDPPHA